jgi:DnaJ-class molecular chaperone
MPKVNYRRKAPRPPDILRKGHVHKEKNVEEQLEICHRCFGEGEIDGEDCRTCGGAGVA